MEKYNVDFFIKKFEKIAESKWTIGSFSVGTKHCALGHCGMTEQTMLNISHPMTEADFLIQLFTKHNPIMSIADINDGKDKMYTQPTPKQRVLAALYDIKTKLQPKEEVKERVVYVTVDQAVRELQQTELIEN